MDEATGAEVARPLNDEPAPAQGVDVLDHAEKRAASEEGRDAPTPGADAPTPGVVEGENEGKAVLGVGGDEGAESEAETLIESPVKKREAERAAAAAALASEVKVEDGGKEVLGMPPPPPALNVRSETPGSDADAPASPVESVEMGDGQAASRSADRDEMDVDKEAKPREGEDSESLSEVSSPNESAEESSGEEAQSRGQSEPRERKSQSPNSRKRKHRASSAGLPNKRQSLQHAQRKLRGLYSEGQPGERSPSPKLRSHRRAASTQSTVMDVAAENSSNRKRRAATHFPMHEAKAIRPGWEESDASSETSRYGHNEVKRSARHIGRSTSTPGRPVGREHKRHVNKYGFTRLAEACESGDIDLVKEWRQRDPEQLELAEFAGNTPLQIAALNGNADVVEYLISEGCKIDSANVDKDTPLIDAAENGHIETVEILLKAGVDPLRQNLKGQQALDVVNDDTDNASEIRSTLRGAVEKWNSTGARQKREEEEERHRLGPSKELHFMARSYENLLKLVTINDRNGVREFLDARVPVDNTTIATAAKTGDSYLLNMLLAEMTEKKAFQKPEKPMLAVLGSSHFEMVKTLAELDQFNPLWHNRQGKTWPQIAQDRVGPNWKAEVELLQRAYDEAKKKREGRGSSSSPVSRRDGGPRRPATPKDRLEPRSDEEEGEEEEEEPAKPKHGPRRLMSRRDMRAAAGKGVEESESEEGEISEDALPDAPAEQPDEETMGPPDSPKNLKKARSKSISMQFPEAAGSPKQSRKRSSSFRGPADASISMGEEKVEDSVQKKAQSAEEMHADNAAHAKFELEQVARLEAKRKEDEAAEATAKQIEEEQKAEDKRKADEEARQRQLIEEQERQRKELEAEERRKQAEALVARRLERRRALLACLPGGLRFVLDPDSEFDYKGEICQEFLKTFCTPLQVVRGRDIDEDSPDEGPTDLWTLNLCAAPLLGKEAGLDLLLNSTTPDCEGFEATNPQKTTQWTKRPIRNPRDLHRRLSPALSKLDAFFHDSLNFTSLYDDYEDPYVTDDESGEDELSRKASVQKKRGTAVLERMDRDTRSAQAAEAKMETLFQDIAINSEQKKTEDNHDTELLPDAPSSTPPRPVLKPEFILLTDVLSHLHPLIERSQLRVRADCFPALLSFGEQAVEDKAIEGLGFFERMARAVGRHALVGTEWGKGVRVVEVGGLVRGGK